MKGRIQEVVLVLDLDRPGRTLTGAGSAFVLSLSVRCRLPMKVGSCRAAFPRFYYDVTNQSCRSFTYGGCGANGNNFDTLEECEAACSGVTGKILRSDWL